MFIPLRILLATFLPLQSKLMIIIYIYLISALRTLTLTTGNFFLLWNLFSYPVITLSVETSIPFVNPTLDKQGGSVTSRQYALHGLHNLTSRFDLVDIWRQHNPNKQGFTRTGHDPRQNKSFINTRIDRFYTSQPITPYIYDTSIITYPQSDHDLIMLTLDLDCQHQGPGYWHFNNTLLDDAIFGIEILKVWTQWRTEITRFPSPLEWWEAAKQHFKRIAIKRSTTLRKLAHQEHNKLERNLHYLKQKATTGNTSDVENISFAKQQLCDLEQRELDAVKIRAKPRFAEEGGKKHLIFLLTRKEKASGQKHPDTHKRKS